MDVVVTYDIDTTTRAGERRLLRVAKTCEGFGIRVQKSVFECRLSVTGLAEMMMQLATKIDSTTDSVNIYRITGDIRDARLSLGRPPSVQPGGVWIA